MIFYITDILIDINEYVGLRTYIREKTKLDFIANNKKICDLGMTYGNSCLYVVAYIK